MRARVVGLYMLFFVAASLWPGATLINRTHPRILGLPFNFAWYALLIVGAFVLLLWFDAEQQRRDARERVERD